MNKYGDRKTEIFPLCDLEVGGQKGIVYYPYGICPALTATQYKDPCKVLIQLKRTWEEKHPRILGGIGEKNFGSQYRQGNRVYDSGACAMAITSQPLGNSGGYSYLYLVKSNENK